MALRLQRFFALGRGRSAALCSATLLPPPLRGYTYRKHPYRSLANGRTGKSAGKSPVSVVKVIVTVLLALGLIGLLVWLFGFSGLV